MILYKYDDGCSGEANYEAVIIFQERERPTGAMVRRIESADQCNIELFVWREVKNHP